MDPVWVQEAELGTGMGLCDQRTRSRIIDRCLAAGQVLRLLVNLPGRRTKHKGFRVEVLARVGTPLDFTFLNEVPVSYGLLYFSTAGTTPASVKE